MMNNKEQFAHGIRKMADELLDRMVNMDLSELDNYKLDRAYELIRSVAYRLDGRLDA